MGNVYIEIVNFGTRKEKNILNNKRGGGLNKHWREGLGKFLKLTRRGTFIWHPRVFVY